MAGDSAAGRAGRAALPRATRASLRERPARVRARPAGSTSLGRAPIAPQSLAPPSLARVLPPAWAPQLRRQRPSDPDENFPLIRPRPPLASVYPCTIKESDLALKGLDPTLIHQTLRKTERGKVSLENRSQQNKAQWGGLGAPLAARTDNYRPRAPFPLNLSQPDSEMGNNDFSNRWGVQRGRGVMVVRRLVGAWWGARHREGVLLPGGSAQGPDHDSLGLALSSAPVGAAGRLWPVPASPGSPRD